MTRCHRLMPLFGFLLLPCAAIAFAGQSAVPPVAAPASTLRYDVVSIKEADPEHLQYRGTMDSPDGVHAIDSLTGLVAYATHERSEFVTCKLALCDKPLYDIQTRVSPEDQAAFARLSYDSKRALLVPVLRERFGLTMHTETQSFNVYDLVAAKGGPKLKPSPDPNTPEGKAERANGAINIFGDRIRGNGVDLKTLTLVLSGFLKGELGRPVVDKTGLTGNYELNLTWTPTAASKSIVNQHTLENTSKNTDDNGGSIFTALRDQLGLELKPAREALPALVIDAAHAPTPD